MNTNKNIINCTIAKSELFKELDKQSKDIKVEVKTNEVVQTKLDKEML